ncbi:MAG: hypothetical protein ACT4N5_04765 [Nitrosopumilaceae archaeon]
MRIDSCRTCGTGMQEFQSCPVCKIVTRFVCTGCGRASEEQVHSECNLLGKSAVAN